MGIGLHNKKLRVLLSNIKVFGKNKERTTKKNLYFMHMKKGLSRARFYEDVRDFFSWIKCMSKTEGKHSGQTLYYNECTGQATWKPTRRRLTQLNEDSSPKGRRLTGAELLARHRQRNPYRDSIVLTRLLDDIKRA